MPSLNRRDLLVSSGTALSSKLAGCAALLGDDQDAPDYAAWIPKLMGEFTLNVHVTNLNTGAHSDSDDTWLAVDPDALEYEIHLGAWGEYFDLDPDILSVKILAGQFNQEAVTDSFINDNSGLAPAGGYAGYQLYGKDPYIGVRDGEVIRAGTLEHLEATVDARRGETNRLVDTSEDFELLVDRISDGDIVTKRFLREHRVARAQGQGITFSNDSQRIREVRVYENEDTARDQRSTVRDEFEHDAYSELEVSVDGRTIIVKVTKR